MTPKDDIDPALGSPSLSAVSDKEDADSRIENGTALCLSGGGYRAMIFHIGSLIRLNEVGLLSRLQRISSVSGGSITAGVLGMNWKNLDFDKNGVATNLQQQLVDPIRRFAGETIDAESVLGGIFSPFSTIGDKITKAYSEHLFGKATLQDLPADGKGPRFVINATNIQTGALWRFSKSYMGDYKVGLIKKPKVSLAVAVCASSAFPPILSPVELDLDGYIFEPDSKATLQKEPFTKKAVLSDGGVYDNMGLETAWKRYRTLLVSDAGARFKPEEKPAHDWARHSIRVLDVIDNQVRSQRKRALIDALISKEEHDGAYWGIATDIASYPAKIPMKCPPAKANELALTPTRLAKLDSAYQDRLINWGYAIASAALLSYQEAPVERTPSFPCQGGI